MPRLPIECMRSINNCIRANLPGGMVFYFMAYDPDDGQASMIASTDDPRDIYPVVRDVIDAAEKEPDAVIPADALSWRKS